MNLFNPETIIGAIGASEYIGVRLAYQFSNLEGGKFRYDQVSMMLAELGLTEYKPHRPSPPDVFRRLTTKINGYYDYDGIRYKIDTIRVADDSETVERVVMAIEVDHENREVSDGRKVARLIYHKEDNRFDVRIGPFGSYDYCPEWLEDMIYSIQARFDDSVNFLSSQQVRDIAIKILSAAGNPVRKISSLWNIPSSREYLAGKLELFANELNSRAIEQNPALQKAGGVLFVDTIPIVSTTEQKKKVSADAVAFALDKFQKIFLEQTDSIALANDTEKAKEKANARLKAEADAVIGLVEEYEIILGEVMEEVRHARTITENKLRQFCSNPEKQAEHKRNLEARKGGRRLQADTGSKVDAARTISPSRRFNLQPGVM